jgi:hypothetical protein
MSTTDDRARAGSFRLNLISLHCARKQDAIGRDEPQLFVDGVSVFGPGDMGRGETVDLRPRSALFAEVARIRLTEVDPGPDDELGTVVASSSQAGQGAQLGEFSRPGADYNLTYEVVPA